MARILAVSSGESSLKALRDIILESGSDVYGAPSAAAARRKVLDEEWDAVVINYPLSDEDGSALAAMITKETESGVIMLVKNEIIGYVESSARKNGILLVEKPILKPVLFQSIQLALSIKDRMEAANEKIRKLENRIEELRVVSKAKCALSLKRGMDEEEAHKTIEKTAMNMRISLKDAAEHIMRNL